MYGILRWPLLMNSIKRGKMGTFGMVRKGGSKPHQGWDLYAEPGTPCFAVADGVVVYMQQNHDEWGNIIVIELTDIRAYGSRLYAAYAHLDVFSPVLYETAKVCAGHRVGNTGNTGNADGLKGKDQHLHFELRQTPRPGLGLAGRFDPMLFYGSPPLGFTIVGP